MLPLSPFSISNGPRHPLYLPYVLDSPLEQPLSRSSLVFPLVLYPRLHTPCISSPNHHHLFAAHAHTNAACSAAISMLCPLHLVSLCMTREMETWLSDSRVGNNSVADHRSRRPVLCPLCDCVMSDHVGCQDASHEGRCSKTSASTGQFGWALIV